MPPLGETFMSEARTSLRVLYYQQPRSTLGGVSSVGIELPKALANKISIRYFPGFAVDKDCLADLFKLVKDLLKGRFNIIHFNIIPSWSNPVWVPVEVAKARNTKTVLSVHGFIPIELMFDKTEGFVVNNLAALYSPRIYRFVDKIVVNSRYMLRSIISYYGIDSGKIVVIPNGVNLRRFSNQEKRIKLLGDPSILYFGGLTMRKGVDILIRAVAKAKEDIPGIKLHVVGAGNSECLKKLSMRERLGDQVVFWGPADSGIAPQFFKGADICVFPSRYEPFGIVILEAFASGKPVIASRVGGIPETVSDGENGLLVKPNDPDALSDAIISLSQDKGLRNKLSENALKTATRYSWENIAREYVSLYLNLANAS
jgi:glycosyltransferase involved in cell wall biosynthesis